MDKYGVIWTRAMGSPIQLADMVLTPSELRITKTQEAIDQKVFGVSLMHDLACMPEVIYSRSESSQLPPQLMALIPPANTANPQRRILAALLERKISVAAMPLLEKDWHMLLFAGHGGIGHLDVFKDNEAAASYYQKAERMTGQQLSGSSIWFAFSRFVADTATEAEQDQVLETVGPTPGVSGFMPKLAIPITIGNSGEWDGSLFGSNPVHAIVKMEQDTYPGLLALEELGYEYHRRANFNVPQTWTKTLDHHGEQVKLLAVERFDKLNNLPLPLESFFSILKTGAKDKYFSSTDGSMEDAAKIFKVLGLPAAMRDDWYRRFVMALLTGNGDMHLENMSILGGSGSHGLSPVYDPAPMRAYRNGRNNHDLLSALPFANIGGMGEGKYLPFSQSGDTPDNLGAYLIEFGKNIGIDPRYSKSHMAELLEITEGFDEHAVSVLEATPKERRKNRAPDIDGFAKTLREVRAAVGKSVMRR